MTCLACGSVGALSPLVATASGVWCEACLRHIKRHSWGYPPMADGAWHAVDVWNGGYPERLRVPLLTLRELAGVVPDRDKSNELLWLQREMPPREVALVYIRQRAVA